MRPLIDPRMRQALPDHWPSLCTIQEIKLIEKDSGQLVPDGALSDVPRLTNIQCQLGPLVDYTPTDDERRGVNITGGIQRRNLKLNGYFPEIKASSMWAKVDGVTYAIVGVDSDSTKFSSRLRLEIVEPRSNPNG